MIFRVGQVVRIDEKHIVDANPKYLPRHIFKFYFEIVSASQRRAVVKVIANPAFTNKLKRPDPPSGISFRKDELCGTEYTFDTCILKAAVLPKEKTKHRRTPGILYLDDKFLKAERGKLFRVSDTLFTQGYVVKRKSDIDPESLNIFLENYKEDGGKLTAYRYMEEERLTSMMRIHEKQIEMDRSFWISNCTHGLNTLIDPETKACVNFDCAMLKRWKIPTGQRVRFTKSKGRVQPCLVNLWSADTYLGSIMPYMGPQ